MHGTHALIPCLLATFCLQAQPPAHPRAIAVKAARAVPQGEQRVALVVGNGAYPAAPLKNPPSDARAMASALRDCGFQVDLVLNADRGRLFQAVREFGQKLSGGGIGLFYYAGHGMAVKGSNYLIPVATDIASEDEVEVQALNVQSVLNKMEAAQNRLNLVILDACRNNPFARGSRSGARGLTQMEAPSGSFIAYATAPGATASDGEGATASDGEGANGLYTRHLLQALRQPGLKVEEVFKQVRVGVKQASKDQQVPWDSSSLTGDFYFRPVAGLPEAPAPTALLPTPGEPAYEKAMGALNGVNAPKSYQDALVLLIEAADQGHAEAQARLGWMYRFGMGTPVNTAKAAASYQKAAEQGNARGLEGLARAYLGELPGGGIARDEGKAFEAMERSASMGFIQGLIGLGGMYSRGTGTAKDEGRALVAYRKALAAARILADAGDAEAQNNLGAIYNRGEGVPEDPAQAFPWLLKAAEQGQPMAQCNLAFMYQSGSGTAQSDAEAAAWYRRAAEQGYHPGQANLGWHYEVGRGVPQSYPDAARWYRKAAEMGNPHAQLNLGLLYQNGKGVAQSDAEASLWLRKAAEQGNSDAQFNLGYMYELGRGLPQSDPEAAVWYRKAADQGHAAAKGNLGSLHLRGRGGARSDEEAFEFIRTSAAAGNKFAQFNLGVMYQQGRGVTKDLVQAEAWFRKASDQGLEGAKKALKDMKKTW